MSSRYSVHKITILSAVPHPSHGKFITHLVGLKVCVWKVHCPTRIYHHLLMCPRHLLPFVFMCIWHYHEGKFAIWWEKIPLLHAQTSPSYCHFIWISNSLLLPSLSPTPQCFLLLSLLTLFLRYIISGSIRLIHKELSRSVPVYRYYQSEVLSAKPIATTVPPLNLATTLVLLFSYFLSKNCKRINK